MNEIVATITDNLELKYHIPRMLTAKLGSIGKGVKVRVDIKRWYKKRSKEQNGYLWSTVYPTITQYILEKTGQKFTSENLHDRYKRKYLGYEQCEIMPDLIKVKSSTELDTKEFWDELIEHICREWAEMGLFIPMPKKVDDVV